MKKIIAIISIVLLAMLIIGCTQPTDSTDTNDTTDDSGETVLTDSAVNQEIDDTAIEDSDLDVGEMY